MLFTSPVFLYAFLPAVFAGYILLPKNYRNALLLIASLFFYAWGETFFVWILLLSIFVNYLLGIRIYENNKKLFLILGILFNIGLLCVFKYAGFFAQNVNYAFGTSFNLQSIHLPIGISFFTFQSVSYLIDVYRRHIQPQRNFIHLGVYISLFPQLIAGPIVRYKDIAPQIANRIFNLNDLIEGGRRFIIGLAKKIIIANQLAEISDTIFAYSPSNLSTGIAWLGIICYTFQIYFDFSGYSDMAIGLSRVFGFRLLENFNYPYIALSITDFWRRWHISLTNWFKDYVYIPLGGNRGTFLFTARNLFLVFLLSGLWHGAAWHFVIWGIYFGCILIIERKWKNIFIGTNFRPLRHIYALFLIVMSWVIFRSPSLEYAFNYWQTLFINTEGNLPVAKITMLTTEKTWIILLIALSASIPWKNRFEKLRFKFPFGKTMHFSIITGLLILSLMIAAMTSYRPFIYFQF